MFDFQRYREFSRSWFRIFKVTSKTLGLGIHPIDNAEPPFVDRPKNVKSINSGQQKRHVRTISEHTLDNSPTISSSSFLNWWSSRHGVETLYSCSFSLSVRQFAISFHAFLRMTLDPATPFACEFSQPSIFSVAPAEIRDSKMFAFTLSASHVYTVQKWCKFSQINQLHQFIPRVVEVLFFLPAIFMKSTFTDENKWTLHSMHDGAFPIRYFSHPSLNRTYTQCLFHKRLAIGWPHRSRPRGITGSSMFDHDLGHLCRGRYLDMLTWEVSTSIALWTPHSSQNRHSLCFLGVPAFVSWNFRSDSAFWG